MHVIVKLDTKGVEFIIKLSRSTMHCSILRDNRLF